MPRPLGRDRLEPTSDETIVLLSLRPKGWVGREVLSPRSPAVPGTAIRWAGALYEVLLVEPRAGGGYRHVLAPWDDRYLVRRLVEYGDSGGPPEPEADTAPVPVAPVEAGRAETRPPEPQLPPDGSVPEAGPAGPASGTPAPGSVAAAWAGFSPAARALAVAFVPSVLLGWFFPFRVLGEGISFFVHELGHTFVAWFFGCSALPAIVLTVVFAQNRAVAAIVWGALAFLAWRYRHARGWNALFAAAAVLYPLLAFTGAHVTAFDLGGHVAELGFAAWAFRRAVRGERAEWERPVWAFFAFYLVARNVKLFGGIVLSAAARTNYLTVAIAGQNDMVKVAATTGIPLTTIAALTAILFLAVPLGALGLALRNPHAAEA